MAMHVTLIIGDRASALLREVAIATEALAHLLWQAQFDALVKASRD